ncbi:hypothetical protein QTN25_003630 [Entamoeba marina]
MSLPLDTEINELNAELDKLVVEYSEKRHELQPLKLHDWFMTDAKQTFHEVVGRAYGGYHIHYFKTHEEEWMKEHIPANPDQKKTI